MTSLIAENQSIYLELIDCYLSWLIHNTWNQFRLILIVVLMALYISWFFNMAVGMTNNIDLLLID